MLNRQRRSERIGDEKKIAYMAAAIGEIVSRSAREWRERMYEKRPHCWIVPVGSISTEPVYARKYGCRLDTVHAHSKFPRWESMGLAANMFPESAAHLRLIRLGEQRHVMLTRRQTETVDRLRSCGVSPIHLTSYCCTAELLARQRST